MAIAYTYTCLVAHKRFRGAPEATASKKVLSLLGAVIGASFLGLLLVPVSPAALGPESMTALLVWAVLGLGFYASRRRECGRLSRSGELDYLILGTGTEGAPTSAGFGQHPD